MAILEDEVWVGVGGSASRHYEGLGYEIPRHNDSRGRSVIKQGTQISVKVKDLPRASSVKVTKVCDICGKVEEGIQYAHVLKARKGKTNNNKDRCEDCIPYKRSLEYRAKHENKQYLLNEYSNRNSSDPDKVFARTGEECWWNCYECSSEYLMSVDVRFEHNCPYCAGRRVNDTNSLWTTHPNIAKLLTDSDVGGKVTSGSGKRVSFKCQNCGLEDKKIINSVVEQGFSCARCSDGISYPEKFVLNLLEQAIAKNFEWEKTFDWSEGKRYDFYIEDTETIIETHGKQHYVNVDQWGVLEDVKRNDNYKKHLAKANGIKNYVIIDSRNSNMQWMRKSIKKSELARIVDLDIVDWKKCEEFALNSMVKEASDLWNKGMLKTKDIAKELMISQGTVKRYLDRATEVGWINYCGTQARRKRVVQLSDSGKYIQQYESIDSASKAVGAHRANISAVLAGRRKTTVGFKWVYLEEYENMCKNDKT